ncbi:GAF domain-containing sensor histidine kinase [Geomonas sp. RF6]|uniref:GAF domain-containing sensor histidine kinase n=1 Tax=Geomonas sp. RF6 TaxID=2897342 RepID=UPI001E538F5C|nr:GAF domain-containing sensor histidine kinase [Geomonas sp. RF6]UFS71124.1 GAF domain-containing sensor histidine kinase [Geomonas sp. RF6]
MERPSLRNTPLYNSRIMNSYLQVIKRKYSYVDLKELLSYAGIKEYEVADQSHWFTQNQVDRFHEKLVQLTGNPHIAREAGRFAASPVALGAMRHYILGLIDAASTFKMINSASANITRSSRYESRKISSNKVEVVVTPVAPGLERPFQCENRIGFFEAIVLIFNRKIPDVLRLPQDIHLPQVQHPECMFRGDPVCRYVVTWEKTFFGYLRKFRDYAFIVLLLANLITVLFGTWVLLREVLLASFCLALIIAIFTERSEKKALRASVNSTRESIDELLTQIDLNYNNALLLNEIGRGLGSYSSTREVLSGVIEAMARRLDYDRGMILLSDRGRERLQVQGSFGYSAAQLHRISRLPFRVDRPRALTILARTFREQRPFLVNSLENGDEGISRRSFALQRGLGASSFICAPIIIEEESVGVLAVDNVKRKKPLMESDISLIMGIASVIGISIRNTELMADLKKGKEELEMRVAQRTEELLRSQKELSLQNQELQEAYRAVAVETEGRIEALERLREQERMLILQSRQAALGEMLSNIAHQWRQPLNVLGLMVQELPVMYDIGTFTSEYLDETVAKAMEVITYMSRTIDDFRNLVRPDKEKIPFHVREVLERTLSLVRESFAALEIELQVDLRGDPVITGYQNEFSQVLFNLLFNARDALLERNAGREKRVTVAVETEESSAVVRVSDNAGGIPEEILEKIFDPYFTTKGPDKGTGIGLYMAKNIIEKNLKGKVTARNVGEGAEFTIQVKVAGSATIDAEGP